MRHPELSLLAGVVLGFGLLGCQRPADNPVTRWRVFPMPRHQPHDGVAVVNQPDGYGIHLYLETDTSEAGRCQPRWLVDPARLFNGNGSKPFSSGVATREEFFEAVSRQEVRDVLKSELKALCAVRAPQAAWVWTDPPSRPSEVRALRLPALEQHHVLTSIADEIARQEALLQNPSQTTGSASRQ